ncbi:MFS multidrug transporter-like protein [Lophium mytilinum]|uniref:MFS multidrug transporter-like protein n=1 Tax=Lophium mytilinum TaxID=390894 RepID=A0A6A6QW58_9PEZI|nr:MFS multidrug transporter-like protein [Lophium mytilinum]
MAHDEDLEELGRKRPAMFTSAWAEFGFCYSIVMSQLLTEYFVSGFNVVLPTVANDLKIAPESATWPAAAFSLVVSAFLIIFGRFADMYGGSIVYLVGTIWLTVFSIVTSFAQDEIMLDLCRALQGLGPAAFLPSGMMLLGVVYRPGYRKNIVFSIYGACAPLGFFLGIFFAGVAGEYSTWRLYFWIGAGLSASTVALAWFCVPSDWAEKRELKRSGQGGVGIDVKGPVLIVCGLVLFVFAITDTAHAPNGIKTWYILTTLIVGIVSLALGFWFDGHAEFPLIPGSIFKVKSMTPLIIAMFFSFASLGIYLLYSTYYMTEIMGGTPMQLVGWFTPMALGGCIIGTVGGTVLHKIPGTAILILAGLGWIVAPLLFALAPVGANYWYFTFWSMLGATIGIDGSFNVVSVFMSTHLPAHQQGLAGALVNSVLQLSIAVFLAVADMVVAYTEDDQGRRQGLKNAFWLELACAGTALVVSVLFVDVKVADHHGPQAMDEEKGKAVKAQGTDKPARMSGEGRNEGVTAGAEARVDPRVPPPVVT